MRKPILFALALFALIAISGCVVVTGACQRPGSTCFVDDNCCKGLACTIPASSFVGTCQYTTESYWSEWRTLAVIGVIISILLVSIAYMFAHVINHVQLKSWAKNELFQAFASAFIIGSIMGLVVLSNSALKEFVIPDEYMGEAIPDVDNAHIYLANKYMQLMVDDLSGLTHNMLSTYRRVMTFAYLNLRVGQYSFPWLGISSSPFSGLSIAGESLSTAFDILVKMIVLVKIQQILLLLIDRALFPALLTMGVIFRTFFFTRKLGGLLIAIALGLYFVYPFAFILMHNLVKIGTGEYVINVNNDQFIETSGLEYVEGRSFDLAEEESIMDTIKNFVNHLGGSVWRIMNEDWLIGERGYLDKTAKWMMYGTFVPFITLMATVGFIRNLSPILGGDVEIAGLTRII